MVAFSGVMKALYESGVLDCATYVAGLSGSTWSVYESVSVFHFLFLCSVYPPKPPVIHFFLKTVNSTVERLNFSKNHFAIVVLCFWKYLFTYIVQSLSVHERG